jgi:hypothetical protein
MSEGQLMIIEEQAETIKRLRSALAVVGCREIGVRRGKPNCPCVVCSALRDTREQQPE